MIAYRLGPIDAVGTGKGKRAGGQELENKVDRIGEVMED
jgi:hypothetical protein